MLLSINQITNTPCHCFVFVYVFFLIDNYEALHRLYASLIRITVSVVQCKTFDSLIYLLLNLTIDKKE